MIFIGLLTDQQKRAGYFVMQNDDIVCLFRNNNGQATPIALFPYDTVRIKDLRQATESHFRQELPTKQGNQPPPPLDITP